jgi:phosphate starvation-inducible protein PhoH and related proteins
MNNSKPARPRLEHLAKLEPMTSNQEIVFKSWEKNNMVLSGSAGTGKTFISLYLALKDVLDKNTQYEKVLIVRSAVPTRDMGFLPGTQEEKEAAYTLPYQVIVNDLFQDREAWDKLTQLKQVEFCTTSYLRGMTFNDCIIIVDEAQNCNYHELCSIITRVGENCKFVMCGDYYQSDFTRQGDKDGINNFLNILENMNHFEVVEFVWKDIVRSGLVRDFIMTKEMYERK